MLGRFVCRASQLGELGEEPRALSVVLDDDLPDDPRIEAIEVPPGGRNVLVAPGSPVEVYVEVPTDSELLPSRAKVRCGGASVPTVEQLARFVRRLPRRGRALQGDRRPSPRGSRATASTASSTCSPRRCSATRRRRSPSGTRAPSRSATRFAGGTAPPAPTRSRARGARSSSPSGAAGSSSRSRSCARSAPLSGVRRLRSLSTAAAGRGSATAPATSSSTSRPPASATCLRARRPQRLHGARGASLARGGRARHAVWRRPGRHAVPVDAITPRLPFEVADYVDFYSSVEHATNLGRLFRPGSEPLLAELAHLPVGYHGRAGTVVVSGTPIVRPRGQRLPPDADAPVFGPTQRLDVELELGFVVGVPSRLGEPVPPDAFAEHVFGVVLVNDWSARDMQAWEYQPARARSSASRSRRRSPPGSRRSTRSSRSASPARGRIPSRCPIFAPPSDWDARPRARGRAERHAHLTHERARRLLERCRSSSPTRRVNGASVRTGDLFASGHDLRLRAGLRAGA